MNARRAPPYLLRCEVSHWMTAGRSNPSPVCGRVVICFPVIFSGSKVETHLLAHGRRELLSAHVCKGDGDKRDRSDEPGQSELDDVGTSTQ